MGLNSNYNQTMLQNPLLLLPQSGNNFVLPIDQILVSKHNSRSDEEHSFHTDLIPEPYIGNVHAPVVALNANPGYDENDQLIHSDPITRMIMLNNLNHNYSDFYYLSNDFNNSAGAMWWRKRLRKLVEATSREIVSKNFFVVESMAYHSEKFKFIDLPSQKYSCELVKKAIERAAIIIIMRSKNVWFDLIPELANYKNLVFMNSWQSTYFSPGNLPRFEEVIKLLIH